MQRRIFEGRSPPSGGAEGAREDPERSTTLLLRLDVVAVPSCHSRTPNVLRVVHLHVVRQSLRVLPVLCSFQHSSSVWCPRDKLLVWLVVGPNSRSSSPASLAVVPVYFSSFVLFGEVRFCALEAARLPHLSSVGPVLSWSVLELFLGSWSHHFHVASLSAELLPVCSSERPCSSLVHHCSRVCVARVSLPVSLLLLSLAVPPFSVPPCGSGVVFFHEPLCTAKRSDRKTPRRFHGFSLVLPVTSVLYFCAFFW